MKPRPIRIDGDVAYVQLTQGVEALIDASDAHLVEGFNWSVTGSVDKGGFKVIRSDRRQTVYLHRIVIGAPPSVRVNHKNGNSLDNRKANLAVSSGEHSKPRNRGRLWHEPGSHWQHEIRKGRAGMEDLTKPDPKKVIWAFGASP